MALVSQFSVWFSAALDAVSLFFFCSSFSSFGHLLASWWARFSTDK